MRDLEAVEICEVVGGELTCTVGFPSGISCTGTLSDFASAYDSVVDWTSRNIIEPVLS
jgi:hypothetical protein